MKHVSVVEISVDKYRYILNWYTISHDRQYFMFGYLNNESHPDSRSYYKSGRLEENYWNILRVRHDRGPYRITFSDNDISSVSSIKYVCKSNEFLPDSIYFYSSGKVKLCKWKSQFTDKINNDILHWIIDNDIELTVDNHEIPDKYKTEFKLRFL